jgi:hypothetical protein
VTHLIRHAVEADADVQAGKEAEAGDEKKEGKN